MSEMGKTLGVIGLGLIGGSMALDLKRRGFASHTLGTESDPVAAEAAGTIGLVDEVVDPDTLVARSDIIVLAVPVGAAVDLLPSILDRVGGTPSHGTPVAPLPPAPPIVCGVPSGNLHPTGPSPYTCPGGPLDASSRRGRGRQWEGPE